MLFLIEQKLLALPILYISRYINRNRSEYYRRLGAVSERDKWYEFIVYMLEGFHSQPKETKEVLFALIEMLEKTKKRIKSEFRKIYSAELVETLFFYPISTPVSLGKRLDLNYRTASRYLAAWARGKVLQASFVGKYHLVINKPLLELLKG